MTMLMMMMMMMHQSSITYSIALSELCLASAVDDKVELDFCVE